MGARRPTTGNRAIDSLQLLQGKLNTFTDSSQKLPYASRHIDTIDVSMLPARQFTLHTSALIVQPSKLEVPKTDAMLLNGLLTIRGLVSTIGYHHSAEGDSDSITLDLVQGSILRADGVAVPPAMRGEVDTASLGSVDMIRVMALRVPILAITACQAAA